MISREGELNDTFWTSLRTVDLKRQRVSDYFSHMIAIIAYFKEINRVLSAVTASSKNRSALSNSVTLQVILHVSKDKDFSTRCSNAEIREVMWEKIYISYILYITLGTTAPAICWTFFLVPGKGVHLQNGDLLFWIDHI